MSSFSPKTEIDKVLTYVLRGYMDKAVRGNGYSGGYLYYRNGYFTDPGQEALPGYGTLEIVEQPEYDDNDSYGDQSSAAVIKFTAENGSVSYYRFDVLIDSYGDHATLSDGPYEVVPKEVQVTRYTHP